MISFRRINSVYFNLFLLPLFGPGLTATTGNVRTLPLASVSRNIFALDIFQKIVTGKAENVIFSPASIQTSLALVFFAADGNTAEELRTVLHLGNGDHEDIAKTFEKFIQSSLRPSKDDNDVQMNMANGIYVNIRLRLKLKFVQIATATFQSQAEHVNFAKSSKAINKINSFVEKQTNQKIKNLLPSGIVNKNTSVVIVNAIYFKGKWQIPFSASLTHQENFTADGNYNVSVDTMYMSDQLQYGELPHLDAKALELRYANSDMSMLFLLPNDVNGLNDLEKKLVNKDLNKIASKLRTKSVIAYIPKFHIEYDIKLIEPLKKMGLISIFSDESDLSGLLENNPNQKVSEVIHKAFIDVNEAGSEAAAATFIKMEPMSINLDQQIFRADHPFMFFIRSPAAVYFAGHVVKF